MNTQPQHGITIPAFRLRVGQWILHEHKHLNERIVDVAMTRLGDVRVDVDHGNGGEPGTSFYTANESVTVNER